MDDFILKSKKLFKDKYDYSKVIYINNKTSIDLTCNDCNTKFSVIPKKHLISKSGCCPTCNISSRLKFKTKEEFIKCAVEIHDDKYDYSLVEYINNSTKVKIICKEHGVFEQTPKNHLHEKGCSICAGNIRLNTKTFIQKAIEIHGDKYDYSKVKYIDHRTKVKIFCKECNKSFKQTPNAHLAKKGCTNCHKDKVITLEKFISVSNKKHGVDRYDYSLVKFTSSKDKVKIKCNECGLIFEQMVCSHMYHNGCKCNSNKRKMSLEEFIIRAIKEHGDKYDYSNIQTFNYKDKAKIKCNECGLIFEQRPAMHLDGQGCSECWKKANRMTGEVFKIRSIEKHGKYRYDYNLVPEGMIDLNEKVSIYCNECKTFFLQKPKHHLKNNGCPHCKKSKGEVKISNIMDSLNINYRTEHIFENFISDKGGYYRFDFYVPELNLVIEFDGLQHFKITDKFFKPSASKEEKEEYFIKLQNSDLVKTKYCIYNNINLVRIPYWHLKKLDEVVLTILNDYKGVYSVI